DAHAQARGEGPPRWGAGLNEPCARPPGSRASVAVEPASVPDQHIQAGAYAPVHHVEIAVAVEVDELNGVSVNLAGHRGVLQGWRIPQHVQPCADVCSERDDLGRGIAVQLADSDP